MRWIRQLIGGIYTPAATRPAPVSGRHSPWAPARALRGQRLAVPTAPPDTSGLACQAAGTNPARSLKADTGPAAKRRWLAPSAPCSPAEMSASYVHISMHELEYSLMLATLPVI